MDNPNNPNNQNNSNDSENQDIIPDIQDTQDTETIEEADKIEEILNIKSTPEMIDSQFFVPEEKKKRFAEELFEWIEIFSSALITVILLFTFIFRLVTVEGPSMKETLHEKDNLIISHLFYTPKQNDIVVIQVPSSAFPAPIIKRVIAIENQVVDINFETWEVTVDGIALDEPYVNYEPGRVMNNDSISLDSLPITVEPGKIFVMGDNRNHSSDSRHSSIGQVDVRNVVGRVMMRIFPLNKFGVVKPDAERE